MNKVRSLKPSYCSDLLAKIKGTKGVTIRESHFTAYGVTAEVQQEGDTNLYRIDIKPIRSH